MVQGSYNNIYILYYIGKYLLAFRLFFSKISIEMSEITLIIITILVLTFQLRLNK